MIKVNYSLLKYHYKHTNGQTMLSLESLLQMKRRESAVANFFVGFLGFAQNQRGNHCKWSDLSILKEFWKHSFFSRDSDLTSSNVCKSESN